MPAVKMVVELDQLAAAGEGPGKAYGHHRCLGAGAVEAHLLAAGHEVDNLLRPLDLESMGGAIMRPDRHLLGDGSNDVRVAMAEDQGAVAHNVVDQLVAV